MVQLSRGSIANLLATKNSGPQITVQMFNVKSLAAPGSDKPARYRFNVTDGIEVANAMASTQLAARIKSGELADNTIITLTNYQINALNDANGSIIVVLDCEVVDNHQPFLGPAGRQPAGAAPQEVPHVQTYAPPPQQHMPSHAPQFAPQHVPQQPAYGQSYAGPTAGPPAYGQSFAPAPVPMQHQTQQHTMQPQSFSSYSAPPQAPTHANKPIIKDDPHVGPVVPISAINPYSSKWTIKARVTAKSDLKRWSNAKGEGTLFSIDLLDSNGGEIRGTFFKEAAAKFFPMIQQGQVYTFSGGVLKIVQNRQYTTIKNQYEITFNQNSEIKPASDDSAIKTQSFNFIKLSQIGQYEVGATIDIIAVVRQASEVAEIVSTKMGGKALKKRDLQLIDETGFEIKLTLWGEKAMEEHNWLQQPICAIKGVKIGDYGGRSLSTLNSSTIMFENSALPEYHQLAHWKNSFPAGGVQAGSSYSTAAPGTSGGGGNESFDKRKTIASIKDEGLGMAEKPDYVVVKGSVVYIKHDTDPWYTACPSEQCNKKVTESMNNEWFCEKCNKSFQNCNRRYILTISMSDHTGSAWFSLFNETAEKLLGHSAQQLHELKSMDQQAYEKVFSDALFKTVVAKSRVKQEFVNEESRIKSSIIKIDHLDLVVECKNMLDAINKYL